MFSVWGLLTPDHIADDCSCFVARICLKHEKMCEDEECPLCKGLVTSDQRKVPEDAVAARERALTPTFDFRRTKTGAGPNPKLSNALTPR